MTPRPSSAAAQRRVAAPAPRLWCSAAYVDLDNTLIKGSALFHLARALGAHGVITRSAVARLAVHHAVFRLSGENARLVNTARNRGLGIAAGLCVEDVLNAADELYDHVLAPRLWPGTLQLLQDHRSSGTPVWLATAAPVELAELIARRLGLSGALGTRAEVWNGAWTGRLHGPVLHGQVKAAAVVEHAAQHGWSLDRCTAYSDSAQDLPMLASVGHPVAVNPDHALRLMAYRRGWPVHDFRTRNRLTAAHD